MTDDLQGLQELSEDLREELAFYRATRPFIAHCLSLNHELNNALAGLLGYAEFLAEDTGNLTEDQQEFVKQIILCSTRIEESLKKVSEEKGELARSLDLHKYLDINDGLARREK